MRLLILSHYFEEHASGIEIVAGQLARRLSGGEIEVCWIAADESNLRKIELGISKATALLGSSCFARFTLLSISEAVGSRSSLA